MIVGTLTMSIIGLKNIIKKVLGERYESASRGQKLRALASEPVKMAYYYLLMIAQLLVMPQIYVGLSTDEYYRLHSMTVLEYNFNVAHWHQLAVMISVALMVHAIDFFQVKGRLKHILGLDIFLSGLEVGLSNSDGAADFKFLPSAYIPITKPAKRTHTPTNTIVLKISHSCHSNGRTICIIAKGNVKLNPIKNVQPRICFNRPFTWKKSIACTIRATEIITANWCQCATLKLYSSTVIECNL